MKRWPLHPQPTSHETLQTYVRRLAECYGVSYPCFCLHALGIPVTDSEARRFKEPSPELLQRLSEGTGVPVDRLAKMTWQHIWAQLVCRDTRRERGTGTNFNTLAFAKLVSSATEKLSE
jgi:hypothetical protein